jgi:ATP-dependent 26S proteasome regulatory subunit
MSDFIRMFQSNYNNIIKITLFNFLKTGDPFYDAIISTMAISIFGYIINYIYDYGLKNIFYNLSFDNFINLFYKKNMIIIEGKRSSVTSTYTFSYTVSSLYSNRFKAILNYIINNIENNNSIYCIKEAHSNFQSSEENNYEIKNKNKNSDVFMVFQNRHFKIDNNIFVTSEIEYEDDKDEKGKTNTKIDKITISIYSYIYSLNYLKNYIDDITEKYLLNIKNQRINKKFIYLLDKIKYTDDEDELSCWREDTFESVRSFNNMFFDGKKEIIEKIDFFLKNRAWYYDKGIPYTLGIGLHGPPGTGKTSFIKALANYTDRHLVVLSLKLIKTKEQLQKFFFENTYNNNNEQNSITFDRKIIVIEDIDCASEIILDRSKNEENRENRENRENKLNIESVVQTIAKINNDNNKSIINTINPLEENNITLDDILNLWDGIRETPGRILIISSNHYNKLDPALIRPGRIDITHELNNVSHKTISEMHLHLFGEKINENKLKKVKNRFYSPAEIINLYITYRNDKDKYMNRLLENKKV